MPLSDPSPKLDVLEVPRVHVVVDSGDLTGEKTGVSVARVEVRHELGRPSSFLVETTDLTPETIDWLDGSAVQEGHKAAIKMGWGERTASVFAGEVVSLELDVSTTKSPRIAIRGYDRLHRLLGARVTRTFLQRKDSDIAADIAALHGMRAVVGKGTTIVHPYVMQSDQTDLAFLLARARPLGFTVRAEGTDLLFGPRRLSDDPVLTAELGKNLLALFIRTSTLGLASGVTARGWDPAEQQEIVSELPASKLAELMGGDLSGLDIAEDRFGALKTSAPGVPILTAAAADLAAAAELQDLALHHVGCEGRLVGAPALRPGDIVRIANFGRRFSGDYWLSRVVHVFDDDGFRTEFEGSRTAT